MSVTHAAYPAQAGLTLVELVMAMSVFSFMLLFIITGIITVVHMRDQAVAGNVVQDNARSAMDELVRGIRNSRGVISHSAGSLCLMNASGPALHYYVLGSPGVLYKADGCGVTNQRAITNASVQVTDFTPTVPAVVPSVTEQEVGVSITLASNNGTTLGAGTAISCSASPQARTFCSVVTLKSGAVPR